MRLTALALVVLLSLGCASAPASRDATAAAPPVGTQPRGSLVIVGGGPRGDAITDRFVALAGGPGKARILVLPMASSLPETGAESVAEWRKHGAAAWSENLTREEAMRPETVRGLDSATGIWFPGGDQVRIMAVLDGTPTAAAIRARYAEGAVVGGTSAGAAVMSKLDSSCNKMICGSRREGWQAAEVVFRLSATFASESRYPCDANS